MRDLTVGQRLSSKNSAAPLWVVDAMEDARDGNVRIVCGDRSSYLRKSALSDSGYSLAVPDHRISEGFYRHRAAGPDDVYYVKGVGILDEDGHGNPDAPRQVFYESTRSVAPAKRRLSADM